MISNLISQSAIKGFRDILIENSIQLDCSVVQVHFESGWRI